MQWTDEGLVIGARRHGETSVILELMTKAHGRHLGLVRGASSRALRPVLQLGNGVAAVWRARLENHLGLYAVEPLRHRAARLIEHAHALHGIAHLCALLRLLPERDPNDELFVLAETVADELHDFAAAPALLARFELALLAALGFGLDIEACALTAAREDLGYVSPKTGRAVSRAAAGPWRDRLLELPHFLRDPSAAPDAAHVAAAFRLTGHFLARDVFVPRGVPMPPARALYVAAVTRAER